MRRFSFAVASVAMLAVAVPAMADLSVGQPAFNPDVTALNYFQASVIPNSWALAKEVEYSLFSATGDFTGEVTSRAYYVNGVDNTGGLGFAYQLSVATAMSAARIETLSSLWAPFEIISLGSDGSGFTTSIGSPGWSDGDPYLIQRSTDGGVSIEFSQYGNGTQLGAGNISAWVWFQTDAKYWTIGDIDVLDSGKSADSRGLMPTLVPLPGAALLIALGLGLVGWLKRRIA